MDRTFSIFLDLTRFLAALLVFFHHAEFAQFNGGWLSPIASFGHDSVIVFFILSGYVIKFVADQKEADIVSYISARAARIYSVVIPSLLLVVSLTLIGAILQISLYEDLLSSGWLQILLQSILFLNQTGNTIEVPTNPPYWSICYEVWYYALFASCVYFQRLTRVILITLFLFIAGFKIVLLLPIWIAGAILNVYLTKREAKPKIGFIILLVTVPAYALIRIYNVDDAIYLLSANYLGGEAYVNSELGFSKRFLSDYLICMIITLSFVGIYHVKEYISSLLHYFENSIRKMSGFTFQIYLFHFPLLVFFSQFLHSSIVIIVSTMAVVFLVGITTNSFKNYLYNNIRNQLVKIM